jgi:hypothetical protein
MRPPRLQRVPNPTPVLGTTSRSQVQRERATHVDVNSDSIECTLYCQGHIVAETMFSVDSSRLGSVTPCSGCSTVPCSTVPLFPVSVCSRVTGFCVFRVACFCVFPCSLLLCVPCCRFCVFPCSCVPCFCVFRVAGFCVFPPVRVLGLCSSAWPLFECSASVRLLGLCSNCCSCFPSVPRRSVLLVVHPAGVRWAMPAGCSPPGRSPGRSASTQPGPRLRGPSLLRACYEGSRGEWFRRPRAGLCLRDATQSSGEYAGPRIAPPSPLHA